MTVRLNLPLLEPEGMTQRGETRVGITRLLPLRFGREAIYTYYPLDTVTSGSEDNHTCCSGMLWVPEHMVLDRSRVDLSSMWPNILGSQALGAHQNFEQS